jgi:hypothetical protein
MMRRLIATYLPLLLLAGGVDAQPVSLFGQMPEPARPDWFQKDAALQTPVTLKADGQPLRVALASLARQSHVKVRASRELEEYRVTLHVQQQPLQKVMGRLLDLFGHGNLPTRGYYWDRVGTGRNPSEYVLRYTVYGRREEEALLRLPMETVVRWLKDIRDYAGLPEERRKSFQTDLPLLQGLAAAGASLSESDVGPIAEAVASLSDSQIESLLQTRRTALPRLQLSSSAQEVLNKLAMPKQEGRLHSNFSLSMERGMKDGEYYFQISGLSPEPFYYPLSIGLDPLNMWVGEDERKAIEEAHALEKGPLINLLAGEDAPAGKTPVTSLNTALSLWARESKRTIYAEIFLKPRRAIRVTSGKPEYLLSKICLEFDCNWRKIGSDYLVWSKSWAQDRYADIPQPLLDRWSARYEKQDKFLLEDLLEMGALSDAKIETLQRVLEATTGPLTAPNLQALRVLIAMHPAARQRAWGKEGAEIAPRNEAEEALLLKILGVPQLTPPVTIRLEQQPTGIGVIFSDGSGVKKPRWFYQGKLSPMLMPR